MPVRYAPVRYAALLALGIAGAAQAQPVATLPQIMPQPMAMHLTGGLLPIGPNATMVIQRDSDPETIRLARESLAALGVTHIRIARHLPARRKDTTIVLGLAGDATTAKALAETGGAPVTGQEGYALASTAAGGSPLIVLAGADADGLYYAAQTFTQIAARGTMPALSITDRPRMPVRGTIEGFYGAPWSSADRLAHIAFLGRLKANTYIYSPKDDPYARTNWRTPYPADRLAELELLIDAARRQHVRFTYAISPGPTICYSDPADVAALRRKIEGFQALGLRSFLIAFDDIAYATWNCPGDAAAFGPPGKEAAGRAQAALVNDTMQWLTTRDPQATLMVVPTEYYDAVETPYKAALHAIDPRVLVQWTGTDVVPAAIALRDAKAAARAFGRKPLLWDNYPVNDYPESTGRLLLAPYAGRAAGLADALSGILANPMNQEAPSRIAVTGSAAFAWNDRDYDPERTLPFAARMLSGDHAATTDALLLLFDLEHLAPTFGALPWQPQAPLLKQKLDLVRDRLAHGAAGESLTALRALAAEADSIAAAPAIIRAHVNDAGFLTQSGPWLDAMALWGQALQASTAGLIASLVQEPASARHFADAAALATRAGAIRTLPGTTRPQGTIRLGDGVLDLFIRQAPELVSADRRHESARNDGP
ncbi:beta-N-acetylhexosaminidase family protein [Novosphingobium rosa]|uniref:beta-N-acetylhexosaminidase family protein n=1 Tax=Novosphingobium rosa TaxID=76978 RepID=UPI00082C1123|nr:beta-N-acetylglucosaminidase domain-containing protein [Novosphingobium rosa]